MIKRNGFLMIELLLVIGVIVGFMGFFYTNIYVPQQKALMVKEDYKNQTLIKRSINQYIKLVATYNKSLYTDGTIVDSLDFIPLEPLSGDTVNEISFRLNMLIIDANPFLNKDLLQAKCLKAGNDGVNYDYKCLGVGTEITLIEVDKPAVSFNDIYSNNIPMFTMRKLLNGNLIGQSEFSFIDTYLMFKEKSLEKLEILRKRLENFNKVTYINEIGNPCSFDGGLDSWDDFNIPWIWKIHTDNLQASMCQTENTEPTITCSCEVLVNSQSLWSDEASLMSLNANGTVDQVVAYENVLSNLSLPKTYKFDEVGNPINILIFAEINQAVPTVLSVVDAPPPPSENYEVNPLRSINEYKQGELFVQPGNTVLGGNFYQDSRMVFFYD